MNWKLTGTTFAIAFVLALPAVLLAQEKFSSPGQAGQSLFEAVQKQDVSRIAEILGRKELTSSGDEAEDKADLKLFAAKYQQMHRLHRDANGSVILYVGAENWPFPVPLVSKNGSWQFDPDAGAEEILYRRIGENELAVIAYCRNLAARKGTATRADLPESLAALQPGSSPVLVSGYNFRILGGGAVIAYPAEYRSSGVMSFAAATNGAVYERDLGPNTAQIASAMSAFHRNATWRAAD